MSTNATSETLLEESIGCGPFQGLIILLVTVLTKVPTAGTFMFMSFGNYNPGWVCLNGTDNNTINSNMTSGQTSATVPDLDYVTSGQCEEFDACPKIYFNPDSSTIVTQWHLLCGRAWISSLIISVQMAGALIGSVIAGQLGDSFGRTTTVYGCLATMGCFNLASMFSNSWQMFAVFRFLLGAAASSLIATYYVLTNEFIPYKWRGPNSAIPAWNVGTIIFSIVAYFVRDWKTLHLSIAIMSGLCFIPFFWVPESLRWLAVKQKTKKFGKVVYKMASLNKKPLPSLETLNAILYSASDLETQKKYRLYHLLHPSIRKTTIIISITCMLLSIIYYAISFGVKNLYGDFYLNLILLFSLEIPFAIFPSFVPNLLGRVKGSIVFVLAAVLCILICAGMEILGTSQAKLSASIIILLAKVSLNSGWCIHFMQMTEMYPTVVRGLSLGWACLMARVGGMLAPFLTPNDTSDIYIYYLAMAGLALFVCGGITQLPETKGRPLRDNLEDDDEEEEGKEKEGVEDMTSDDNADENTKVTLKRISR